MENSVQTVHIEKEVILILNNSKQTTIKKGVSYLNQTQLKISTADENGLDRDSLAAIKKRSFQPDLKETHAPQCSLQHCL